MTPISPAATVHWLARLERWSGAASLAAGVLVMVMWRTSDPRNAPHGGFLLLISAPFLLGVGASLIAAAIILTRGKRWRWLGQVLPVLVLCALSAFPHLLMWLTGLIAMVLRW
jgi:hypothetical protein